VFRFTHMETARGEGKAPAGEASITTDQSQAQWRHFLDRDDQGATAVTADRFLSTGRGAAGRAGIKKATVFHPKKNRCEIHIFEDGSVGFDGRALLDGLGQIR